MNKRSAMVVAGGLVLTMVICAVALTLGIGGASDAAVGAGPRAGRRPVVKTITNTVKVHRSAPRTPLGGGTTTVITSGGDAGTSSAAPHGSHGHHHSSGGHGSSGSGGTPSPGGSDGGDHSDSPSPTASPTPPGEDDD